MAGAYSGAEIDRLRGVVSFAEQQFEFAKNAGGKQGMFNLFTAESSLRNAEDNLEKAIATNARAPGAVSETALEKLRLTVELARLNLAKGRAAAESNSPTAMMQWQIDQMRIDLLQLRNRVEAISARR